MSGWTRRRIQWGNQWFPLGRFKDWGFQRGKGKSKSISPFVAFACFLTSESMVAGRHEKILRSLFRFAIQALLWVNFEIGRVSEADPLHKCYRRGNPF